MRLAESAKKSSDPTPNSSNKSSAKWIVFRSLLAAVSVFAACELAARFLVFVDPPVRSGNQLFEEKLYILQSITPGKPVIFCMGDSKMNRAIYPDLLKALLAKNGLDIEVANLAVDGAPPSMMKKLLKLAVEHQIVPKLVICDMPITCMSTESPAEVTAIKNLNLTRAEDKDPGLKFLYNTSFGRGLLEKQTFLDQLVMFVDNHSELIKYRGHFKSRIKEFANLVFNYPAYEMSTRKKTGDYNLQASMRGWNPNHTMLDSALWEHQESLINVAELHAARDGDANQPAHVVTENYAAIQQFCTQHNICFSLVWLPHYAPFFDKHAFSSGLPNALIAEKIRGADDARHNLHTIVIEKGSNDLKCFTDPWHINTYGAVETTRALSEVLCEEPYRGVLLDENIALH